MDNTNTSKCMMGAEGFSWCDTETLFKRDGHWFDWDSCSLCHNKDLKTRKVLIDFLTVAIAISSGKNLNSM